MSSSDPILQKARHRSMANQSTTEWNVAATTNGTFQGQHWPSHLPKPPSRKHLLLPSNPGTSTTTTTSATPADPASGTHSNAAPTVIVFNANTPEGSSMVRVLSEKKMNVVAVVRVFTSKTTKQLIQLPNVTVKVADLNNFDAVVQAAQNCQSAFLITKYWERFESPIEEHMAKNVLSAAAQTGTIRRFVLATFEDTLTLRLANRKSQLIPTSDGRVYPSFDGMTSINEMGQQLNISMTHMFTSYLDETKTPHPQPDHHDHNAMTGGTKKSIILIRSAETHKIICQSHIEHNHHHPSS